MTLLGLCLLLSSKNGRGFVRRCYSFSCKNNKKGKCSRENIDVYDNMGEGLCLWHTSSMEDRLIKPFSTGVKIGERNAEITFLDALIREMEDAKAIKDPEEFRKWVERHMK